MFNTSYDMWQKVRSYKIVSYCSGHDMQKGFNLKQCSFCSNVYEKVVLTIISLRVNPQYIQKRHKKIEN